MGWADRRAGVRLDLQIALIIFVIFVSLCENSPFWDQMVAPGGATGSVIVPAGSERSLVGCAVCAR